MEVSEHAVVGGVEQTLLLDKVVHCFRDFMTRVAKFDELTKSGLRFLKVFQHELEIFRRPAFFKTSVKQVLLPHMTERLTVYLEAGCRDTHSDLQNTQKLPSCLHGLQEHLKNARLLLDELEGFTEDAIGIMQEANESTSSLFENITKDGLESHLYYSLKEEKEMSSPWEGTDDQHLFVEVTKSVHDHCDRILHLTIMMKIVYNMLKLDYTVQEKVINTIQSLNLITHPDQLESYSLMWELRPYVDEKVMQQCWRLVN